MKAVFLDRDGVINRATVRDGKPYPPRGVEQLEILPDVPAALEALKARGFLLLVVTNQPDVARGTESRSTVEAMHESLRTRLPLDDFFVCYHDDRDACVCRKPLPGLILEGARKYGVDLAQSFMVGDRWRDVEAGARAGVRTVFLDYGYRERRPEAPDAVVRSMAEAAEWVLQQHDAGSKQ